MLERFDPRAVLKKKDIPRAVARHGVGDVASVFGATRVGIAVCGFSVAAGALGFCQTMLLAPRPPPPFTATLLWSNCG